MGMWEERVYDRGGNPDARVNPSDINAYQKSQGVRRSDRSITTYFEQKRRRGNTYQKSNSDASGITRERGRSSSVSENGDCRGKSVFQSHRNARSSRVSQESLNQDLVKDASKRRYHALDAWRNEPRCSGRGPSLERLEGKVVYRTFMSTSLGRRLVLSHSVVSMNDDICT